MPVYLTPPPEAVIPTKPVSMPDWETTDEYAEHIDILIFLRLDVLEAARKAARRTIVEGGKQREEFNDVAYYRSLFSAQVKGWRLLDPYGAEIPFTQENLAALPPGVVTWLHEEILACNGSIPTRELIVRTEGGHPLTFKSTDGGVGTEQEPDIPTTQ